MKYLMTTEAPMRGSGLRRAPARLDRPSMAPSTPEHQPARAPALDADYRVWPTPAGSPRAIRRSVRRGRWPSGWLQTSRTGCSGTKPLAWPGFWVLGFLSTMQPGISRCAAMCRLSSACRALSPCVVADKVVLIAAASSGPADRGRCLVPGNAGSADGFTDPRPNRL